MMTRRIGVLLVLPVALLATAATSAAQSPPPPLEQLRAASVGASSVEQFAFYLTDVSGPRLTGSAQFRVAAEWARRTLGEIGLTDVEMKSAATPEWAEPGWSYRRYAVRLVEPTCSRRCSNRQQRGRAWGV